MAKIRGQQIKSYLVPPSKGGIPEPLLAKEGNQVFPSWTLDWNSLIFAIVKSDSDPGALYLFNLKTQKLSQMPGSEGLHYLGLVS